MNTTYPYTSPIIMDDATFQNYGGNTGTGAAAQRTAAYLMAEMALTEDLSTFLLPTTITGTYFYNPTHRYFITDYAYIHSIGHIKFIDFDGDVYYTITGTDNIYAAIRDNERGIIDIQYLIGYCKCSSHGRAYPYQIEIAYTSGLPTGTATQPDFLLALTTYSDLMLNEIIGYGNESPGDIGIQQWSNQEYRENRVKLMRTTFGTSARANFVARLVRKYKRRRLVRL